MMAEVAGEVADGLLVHGFTTQAYLENVTLPAIERGFAKSGRSRDDFEISYPVFSVTGRDEKEIAAEEIKMRQQIAFYGSTPAYKPVLDSIDMGELQPELNAMSKQGRWEAMGELIDDKCLHAISVQGDAREVARQIKSRYSHIADRTAASYSNMGQADKLAFLEELQKD
jgi:probable F420-dependent oxidoreductase